MNLREYFRKLAVYESRLLEISLSYNSIIPKKMAVPVADMDHAPHNECEIHPSSAQSNRKSICTYIDCCNKFLSDRYRFHAV